MKSSSEHLHKQFYASIEEHKMLIGTKKILVAFSGGADSTALLLLLHELAKERSLPLAALHVNHMIRGDEADRDEAFCRSLCDSMMIPLYVERADIPALAKASGKPPAISVMTPSVPSAPNRDTTLPRLLTTPTIMSKRYSSISPAEAHSRASEVSPLSARMAAIASSVRSSPAKSVISAPPSPS